MSVLFPDTSPEAEIDANYLRHWTTVLGVADLKEKGFDRSKNLV